MHPISLLRLFIFFSMSGATVLAAGCGSDASSSAATTAQPSTARTARLCAGTPIAAADVATCPAPAGVRPGHACDATVACPSPNLLFGTCRCRGGTWSCDEAAAPKGYDPYPDCLDEGVEPGTACYLESSTCLPAAAATCFTKGAPLCQCVGHTWTC
jgi:hypothetical protein